MQTCAGLEGKNETYLRFFGQYLEGFPVPTVNSKKSIERQRQDRISQLAQAMQDLHAQLAATKPGHAKTIVERQIVATDRQIDQLVYELYGLTEEEIRVVEEGTD
jgi:hypothetical protein